MDDRIIKSKWFYLIILAAVFSFSCSDDAGNDLGLNPDNGQEVFVFTGELGDLPFHSMPFDSSLWEPDDTTILKYCFYEFMWNSPKIDFNWEIKVYLWLPRYPYGDPWDYPYKIEADIKSKSDYVTFNDTCQNLIFELPLHPFNKPPIELYYWSERRWATTDYDNRVKIFVDNMDTSATWPRVNPLINPQDTTFSFAINYKTDFWDHRQFKVVLIKPSTVSEL